MSQGLEGHMQIAATHCEEAVAYFVGHYPDTILGWPPCHAGQQSVREVGTYKIQAN